MLLQAHATHDANLDDYRARTKRYLERLHPAYAGNTDAYTQALLQVVSGTRS